MEETPLAPSMAPDCPDRLLKARIPFLLRYYDSNNTVLDLIPALDAGRPKAPSAELGEATSVPLEPTEGYLDESQLSDSPLKWLSSIELSNHATHHEAHSEPAHHEPRETLLSQRVQELIKNLNQFAGSETSRAHLKNTIDQDLFSVANIRAFEHLYVQHFHRHCPIIHLPTFQAESATLPLLLAIFLGGALYSYPRDTHFLAVDCLDIAEEYLFSLPVLDIGYKCTAPSPSPALEHYEALKALAILSQLQIGRNDHDIRRRIRYERFPRVVHAARCVSLFSARKDDDSSPSQLRVWDAQSETLARYHVLKQLSISIMTNPIS